MAKMVFKYRPPPGVVPGDARDSESPPESVPSVELDVDGKVRKVDRWWYESSYDLRTGLDVRDDGDDTVPAELLDELFSPPAPPQRKK